MPCWAPLLSLSHCLLLLCPSFSLFLKNLLSSSPQSSGPECPRHVRLRELLISHSPWPRRAALHICCDSLWKLNMCTEVPHQSCGGAGTVFIYLLTPEESYSPFIPPEPAAGLLLAQQVECELRSLCLPWGAGEAQSWWPLSRAQGHSQREGGPTPAAEILTNSACFLQKPHFSSLLYPGRDLVFYDSAQTRGTGISQCLSYSSDI